MTSYQGICSASASHGIADLNPGAPDPAFAFHSLRKKKFSQSNIYSHWRKKQISPWKKTATNQLLPPKQKLVMLSENVILTTHRKSVTAALDSEKLVPSRPASHPDSSCLGSALKGASCLRTLRRRAFKWLPLTDLILSASSADTKDQSLGRSCSWKYQLHTD